MIAANAISGKEWSLLGSLASEADQEDIRLCLDGDEDAFARLVKRYEPQIASQMWRFTRDPQRVEELVQEVFVEAYLSLGRYKGKAPFLHWLRRIATRVGYRHWKHKSRDKDRKDTLYQQREWLLNRYEPESPSEAGEFVYNLLEELPAPDRLVLSLLYFEQWDTKEIAEYTGWSRSLVKVRAFRARKKLRQHLEDAGYDGTQ